MRYSNGGFLRKSEAALRSWQDCGPKPSQRESATLLRYLHVQRRHFGRTAARSRTQVKREETSLTHIPEILSMADAVDGSSCLFTTFIAGLDIQ